MDVIYRISSGEVEFIGTLGPGAGWYDPVFQDVLVDPPVPDGIICTLRVLGYAKINDNGTVRNATQIEIDGFAGFALDDKNQEEANKAAEYFQNDPKFRRVMIAFAAILVDEINILRAEHGLSDRTLSQLKTAIQNRISKDD